MMTPPAPAIAQAEDGVAVRAARFYRAEGNQTRVRAFVQVPLSLMTPTVSGPAGTITYRIMVQVRDSSGLKLLEDAWPWQHVRAGLQEAGAFTVNMMEFHVLPGAYELEVTVEDSVTGLSSRAVAEISGFVSQPLASDLLLSPMIRPVTGDSVPSGSEWRAGQVMITSIANLRLTPLRSTLYYYLEAYSDSAVSGTMQMAVSGTDGKAYLERPARPVQFAAGGGILMGDLELEGLPGGTYDLDVSLAFGGDTVSRIARFEMAGLEETVARAMERKREMRITDQGFFDLVPPDSLDRLEEPLVYLADGGELKPYSGLSVQGKRNFLTQFWQKRDPDPSTPRNEIREQFYAGIAYAEQAFGEPGRNARPGWKTPRGEVWARYGRPDEQLERIRVGNAPTYEVWRYTRARDRYFVFADRTGLGNYVLLHSNDLELRGLPTWRDVLTEDAVRDIGQFLGINFYSGFSGNQ
ncbi:MAG: GWxTD domain-containing protein, partial [Gemmatimonadales bacterium]